MKTLNKDGQVGEISPFMGEKQLLIIGAGSARVLRSLDKGENFYPMTDLSGNIITLRSNDGVLFNAAIENKAEHARFQIELLSGQLEYEVV